MSKKTKNEIETDVSASSLNVLNDLRSYSRHWLSEFIETYQAEACLWQAKHPDYSNHAVRNKAYDKLVDKLREVEPNPDRAMVVRKINSLRSAFRREYRKTSSKSNYETRLWYFDKLLFIADQKSRRLVGSGSKSEEVAVSVVSDNVKLAKRSLPLNFDDDSMEYEADDHIDGNASQNSTGLQKLEQSSAAAAMEAAAAAAVGDQDDQEAGQRHIKCEEHTQHQHAVKVLEITSLDSNSQREIQQAVNSLEHQHQIHQHLQNGQQQTSQLAQIHHQQVPTIQIAREHLQPLFNSTYSTRQEDEYDAIGVNVASKLRVMNPTQRIIAEKLISDVLFNGQLDNLSISSSLVQ